MHSFLKTYYSHTTPSLHHHFTEAESKSGIPAAPQMPVDLMGTSEEKQAKEAERRGVTEPKVCRIFINVGRCGSAGT